MTKIVNKKIIWMDEVVYYADMLFDFDLFGV